MVGMMAAVSREKVADLLNSSKLAAAVPSKMGYLRRLKDEVSDADSILLTEFLPLLLDFVSDRFSPVRKFTIEMLSPIGIRHIEFLPAIIPLLITALKDDTPAVARQSITCGIEIFRSMLFKVAIQGLYSSELDDSLETSWAWVQKFMYEICTVAFQPALDGRSLLAIKFVESVILLYTPNPNVSSEPPSDINAQGNFEEFNISWLRGGHPILKVGELSAKASNSLSSLLNQLRFPAVKSLSNLMIIVLINSLSAIATKRPAFYGRILPVLMGLDPSTSDGNDKHVYAVHHALKNAFLSCLNCTHPGSAPWRDRLIDALKEMKPGVRTDRGGHQVSQANGKVEPKNELCASEDAKPSIKTMDAGCNIAGAKRPVIEINDNSVDVDGEMSRKRVKSTPAVLEGKEELSGQQDNSLSEPTTSRTDSDNSAVQQLVAMFGSLVAQGEKAQSLLEMLISSISGDLLAEVVMANMRNVPPNRPNAEEDDELLMAGSHLGASTIGTGLKQLSLLLTDNLSQPSTLQQNDIPVDAQFLLSSELEQSGGGEEQPLNLPQIKAASDSQDYSSDQAPKPVSFSEGTPIVENIPVIAPEVADVGNMGNAIPGIDSFSQNDGSAAVVVPLPSSTDLDEASQEHVSGLARSDLEALPSISTDRSEELSPKAAVTDATNIQASTATSVEPSPQLVLPKMSAPVVHLSDEQRDNLQKSVLVRVIDAYKQVAVAGGSHARLSILAHLAVKLPSELDAWKMLQVHILSDYVNHEGHELTLRVLYRLYGQAEEDQDFFSSTAAASAYEMFLLTVAETLRDSFPASDKSLSRLLGDAPHLPNSIFKLLECLCCPGSSDNDDKELYSGDRVTQGLSAVWSLILLRPPIRNTSLNIALQSAAHHLEEVRMKAIRLVANRLFPLPSISQQIETFANEMLLSVINVNQNTNSNDDGTNTELQQDSNLDRSLNDQPSTSAATKEMSSDTHQSSTSESISSSSVAEAQRCMSLYFALCTKKHSLFRHIFITYKSGSKAVKQAIDGQIPMLVRTIGSSPELLEIISDPPNGSEELMIQVLRTLTEGTVPSPELIALVKQLYETKVKDVEILLPVLPFLSKEEVLRIFPHLVNAPLDIFQAALSRVLEGSSHSGPMLTPAEALIAIHGIDPDRDHIPLKKVTDACNACFDQRQIFTQQVLAKVLNQLVEQIPLPLLFMRTVLQAIVAFPSLVDFIMEILSRLVSKQIWKYPKLWVGFVKCAQLTKPQSFSVLLQLPPAQLENALNKVSALKAPLVAHASQPHIKSSLPRSVLVVLGIASDSQSSSQAQPPQPPTDDKESSDKEAVTEVSKESSAAS